MTISFRTQGRASEQDIAILEEAIRQPISHGFREFVMSLDGAEPDQNSFSVNEELESGVNEFIPVRKIVSERANIENIHDSCYPFAWAEGGNYLLIDEGRQGAVFFWDHEVPDQEHKIADSFKDFLDLMQPFDPASIQLAPGQVRSAWIDPDFLKKFGN